MPAGGRGNDVGFSVQVVFDGQPLTLRATVPLYPLSGLAVTVYVVLPPCTTVCELGEAVSEKSGTGGPPQPLNFSDARRVLQSNEAVVW